MGERVKDIVNVVLCYKNEREVITYAKKSRKIE